MKEHIDLSASTVLVTGAAGFIGAYLALKLLDMGTPIHLIGIDNLNSYYDVALKEYRLERIAARAREQSSTGASWTFHRGSIANAAFIRDIFERCQPDIVVNLAAQAGVRYSIDHPDTYIESNIVGFYQILEACRHSRDEGRPGVRHLVYASSSSVYGVDHKIPYSVNDPVDRPVSLYAATKKSDELLAHAYAKLYDIPCTGLRFFTVYGPAGRPDMAYFSFTDRLRKGQNIRIFNYGNCLRDFTYIDDITEGIARVLQAPPASATGEDGLPIPPYSLYNIGNNRPENLLNFVDILQQELVQAGVLPKDFDWKAHLELVAMQPADVPVTCADISELERDFAFKPHTTLRDGLRRFAEWYREYYRL